MSSERKIPAEARQLAALIRAGATPPDHDGNWTAGERTMKAAELLMAVQRLCEQKRLWVMPAWDIRQLNSGWPDVVIIAPYQTLFRQLKSDTADLSQAQVYVIRSMMRAGLDAGVWRPMDYLDGSIERRLDEMTGRWQGKELTIKCQQCDRRVIADNGRRRFCSDKCRERFRYWKKKEAAQAASPRLPASPSLATQRPAKPGRPRLALTCPALTRSARP
jgi:hypothetical protein